jgi:hypothetical protein
MRSKKLQVYNLLPDCLSKLLESDKLREEQLQAILAVLLGYVKVSTLSRSNMWRERVCACMTAWKVTSCGKNSCRQSLLCC